jgi:hypothetical protein
LIRATARVILRVTKVSPLIGLSWLKEDAVGGVHPVGLAIVHRDPVGVELGRGVGAAGVKRGGLGLRGLLDLAVELGGGGLVEAHLLLQPQDPDGVEQAQGPQGVSVGRVFRGLKAHLHVTLGGEVVDLIGPAPPE